MNDIFLKTNLEKEYDRKPNAVKKLYRDIDKKICLAGVPAGPARIMWVFECHTWVRNLMEVASNLFLLGVFYFNLRLLWI